VERAYPHAAAMSPIDGSSAHSPDSIRRAIRSQGWSVERYRLPEDWFHAEAQVDRFAGVQFWGGTSLHRTTI
jgi:hypothetical protein